MRVLLLLALLLAVAAPRPRRPQRTTRSAGADYYKAKDGDNQVFTLSVKDLKDTLLNNDGDKTEIPEFKPDEGMRAYRRAVALYQKNTRTPLAKQASKLLEKIKDTATAEHCEVLWDNDFAAIANDDGVKILLDHLGKKHEVTETAKKRKVEKGIVQIPMIRLALLRQ